MPDNSLSRRQFAKSVAVGAIASTVPVDACADKTAAGDADKPRDSDKDDDANSTDNLAAEIVRRRYPDRRLTGKVLDAVRGDIRGDQLRAKALKSVPLFNGDEPAFVFAAFRADDIR